MTDLLTPQPPELRAALERDTERRFFARLDAVEPRSGGDVVFTGYASVFDVGYDIAGVFRETVRPGAFARTLKNRSHRIHLLVNHDSSGVPLASVEAGTMQLAEDERGLRVQAALDPSSPWAQSVLSAVRRGDLAEMSFAFQAVRDAWNEEMTERELLEVKLFEVSVVGNGANPATTATLAAPTSTNSLTISVPTEPPVDIAAAQYPGIVTASTVDTDRANPSEALALRWRRIKASA